MLTSTPSKTQNRNNRRHSQTMQTLRRQATAVKKDTWGLAETAGVLATEQLDPLRGYVSEKPVQSLLIAGGVGLILGILFGRR